ncbi:MAG: hypothetical protein ABIO70_28925 [Pseudomonadota bacterium]
MFALLVHDPNSGSPSALPLDLPPAPTSLALQVATAPGASALWVEVVEQGNGQVAFRGEVPILEQETVDLRFTAKEDGGITVEAPLRQLRVHAPQVESSPGALIDTHPATGQLDLVLLVDATTRYYEYGSSPKPEESLHPLWSADEKKRAHIEELTQVADRLMEAYPSARLAVVAFADARVPGLDALQIQPRWEIWPELPHERELRTASPSLLAQQIEAIQASSGGDFVDALAEGLRAVRALAWRPGARKLVILTGDSPGGSVRHPPPEGAAAQPRRLDVDEEVESLHEQGVEVLSIFHDVPYESGLLDPDRRGRVRMSRVLLRYAEQQYQRMATHGSCFWMRSKLDPAQAAKAVLEAPPRLGRGACLGSVAG